ncbi:MAG: hypothetical protein AB1696_15670 [Planctomycetota bacterium]
MRTACLVILLAVQVSLFAQDAEVKALASKEECRALCDGVMKAIAGGQVGGGFAALRPYWVFSPKDFADYQIKTIQKMTSVTPTYGKVVGWEFVRQDAAGESLLRLTYLHKFERHALGWVFIFYKPRDQWLLNEFRWDEELERVFE